MTHTLDLFDTTVDTTSMTPQDVFTSVLIFAAVVILICVILSGAVALYRDHQDSHRSGDAREPSIAPHVIIALAGLISLLFLPYSCLMHRSTALSRLSDSFSNHRHKAV